MMSITYNVPTFTCKQKLHLLHLLHHRPPPKEKVVVVMGPTGAGKSRLSVDLATRFSDAEIVNSDKMQVYQGFDIVTNKVTEEEAGSVPHHLLGIVDPDEDFTTKNFCVTASRCIKSITGRGNLPIIVGGSNSFIEALVDDEEHKFKSRYDCCFLWVDVSPPVLHSFVSERVDRMVEKGMIDEVRAMFDPDRRDYSKGLRRAIGMQELDLYFRMEPTTSDEIERRRLLDDAINDVKMNTRKLACRQLEKIKRLRNAKGWKIHRLDATSVFLNRGHGGEAAADEAWEKLVLVPTAAIVHAFLNNHHNNNRGSLFFSGDGVVMPPAGQVRPTVAAAFH